MELKRVKTNKSDSTKRKEELKESISKIEEQLVSLEAKRKELRIELLKLEIAPFKIGGYALAKVPSGKSVKEQKCLLECEDGILFVRPIKADGELSGRHFSCTPISGRYSEVLKKVEE